MGNIKIQQTFVLSKKTLFIEARKCSINFLDLLILGKRKDQNEPSLFRLVDPYLNIFYNYSICFLINENFRSIGDSSPRFDVVQNLLIRKEGIGIDGFH